MASAPQGYAISHYRMEINDVKRLANLSRLEIDDREAEALLKDLESVLEYVSVVSKVEITDSSEDLPINRNVMRPDEVTNTSGAQTEILLEAAPDKQDGFIKVKKIL